MRSASSSSLLSSLAQVTASCTTMHSKLQPRRRRARVVSASLQLNAVRSASRVTTATSPSLNAALQVLREHRRRRSSAASRPQLAKAACVRASRFCTERQGASPGRKPKKRSRVFVLVALRSAGLRAAACGNDYNEKQFGHVPVLWVLGRTGPCATTDRFIVVGLAASRLLCKVCAAFRSRHPWNRRLAQRIRASRGWGCRASFFGRARCCVLSPHGSHRATETCEKQPLYTTAALC